MKKRCKRLLCLLFVCVLLLSMLPAGMASDRSNVPDYTLADEILDGLYTMLRGRKALLSDSYRADLAERYLTSAEGVVAGSVYRVDDALFWQTEDGITCHFSPRLYELMTDTRNANRTELPGDDSEEAWPMQTMAVSESTFPARDVYLMAPYYGLADEFQGEGGTYDQWTGITAHFTGGRAYRLTGQSVTVEALAKALENSAMVFIDSHGDTDTGDDRGHTSYICLQSGAGLTAADYAYDSTIGASHACYGGAADGGRISYYEVDGTVIARRMTGSASNCFVWNGACYGMANSGFCGPLLRKGVGAVYGYSQAVSFGGDLCWMDTALDALTSGKTIAQAVDTMRSIWGNWDYSRAICEANEFPLTWANGSAKEAASHSDAFPVVVSANDPYPTNPNAVQTVRCAWKLPQVSLAVNSHVPDGVKCPKICGFIFYQGVLPYPSGIPRNSDHSYTFLGWCLQSVSDTTARPAQIFAPGDHFSFGYDNSADPLCFPEHDIDIYALYSYSSGGRLRYTTQVPDGPYDPYDPSHLFSDMPYGTWYYGSVRYAVVEGLVNGYTDGSFRPMNTLKRSEVVSVLYRAAGSPAVNTDIDFTDVSPTSWYASAIAWAVQSGIVQGYSDNTFRPDQSVTRAQLAAFFYRFAGAADTGTAAIDAFPDRAQVPEWAAQELAWAVRSGLINGSRIDSRDYLQPVHEATRAQFVAILQRYFEG